MKKGAIRTRGLRSPIPKGFILGRSDDGIGDAHPIKTQGGLAVKRGALSLNLSGDVAVDPLGATTVKAIQHVPLDQTAPSIGQFLQFDGTSWTPANSTPGSGDFSGPPSSVTGNFVSFADGTGKLGADSGVGPSDFDAAGDAAAAQAAAQSYTDSLLVGGSTGQVLTKDSGTDLDFSWHTPSGGGGGSGIDQLTGDVTAGPGSGSQAATLATVNSDVGTFGDATHVAQITVNAKGLVTAVNQVSISGGGGGGGGGKVLYGEDPTWGNVFNYLPAGFAMARSTIVPDGGSIDRIGFMARTASGSTTFRVAVYDDAGQVVNAKQQESNLQTGVAAGRNSAPLITPYVNSSGNDVIVWLVVVGGVADAEIECRGQGGFVATWDNSGTTLPATAPSQSSNDYNWVVFGFGDAGT